MHRSPSIVPGGDQNVYLVADDFGRSGQVWPETDLERTDLETVIRDLLEGQYRNPIRVVGFNTAEHWSADVSADIAQELRQRCADQLREMPAGLLGFVDRHDPGSDIQLLLPIRLA